MPIGLVFAAAEDAAGRAVDGWCGCDENEADTGDDGNT